MVPSTEDTAAFPVHCHRDWAFLPPPILDNLVDVLKQRLRWRCDGPSLRLVNKHWSEVVDHNVQEVRPHHRRTLIEKDIASLLKFPRLTSVDISRFLVDPPRHETRRGSRKSKAVFRGAWYNQQLERVTGVLSQLPRLWHLEMSHKTLNICHYQCTGAKGRWSELDTIRSLYCYSFENLKLYGDTPLNTTWIRQSCVSGDASEILETVVGALHSLNTVELQANLFRSTADLSFLEGMDTVKLQGVDSMESIALLPNPSATVSSLVLRSMPDAFEKLASLDHMKSLGLFIEAPQMLNDASFVQVLRHLKVLELAFKWTARFIPNEVFDALDQLECLNLSGCLFYGRAAKGKLQNLTVLRIKHCCVKDNDVSFLSHLKKLEGLHWVGIVDRAHEWLDLPLHEAVLPRLRLLSISVNKGDATMKAIAQLTNLEVLFLEPLQRTTINGMRELEKLSKLRILYISTFLDSSSPGEPISHLLSFDMITKLEQLLLLLPAEVLQSLSGRLQEIQKQAPQLIVEVGSRSLYSRTRCLAEDAFFI